LSLLEAEELIVGVVHFFADLLPGLEGHQHELQMFAGVEHTSEIIVALGHVLDIPNEALHDVSSCCPSAATFHPNRRPHTPRPGPKSKGFLADKLLGAVGVGCVADASAANFHRVAPGEGTDEDA